MKKRLLLLLMTVAIPSVFATKAYAEPCGAVLCLSVNEKAPWECKSHVEGYFDIRVYHKPCKKCKEVFDPAATAIKRHKTILEECKDARPGDRDKITALYGPMEYYPYEYAVTHNDFSKNKTEEQPKTRKVKTRLYITCKEAAQHPEYNLGGGKPTALGLTIPDKTVGYVNGIQVTAESGYLSWPLYDEHNRIAAHGFASIDETKTIDANGNQVGVSTFELIQKLFCAIDRPEYFK